MLFRRKKKPPKVYTTPQGAIYPLYADMLKQSHLLIAGATGSGKSVLVNQLMHTALYRSPASVRFILIDCKRGVELRNYASLPHTLAFCKDKENAIQGLQYAINIMNDRFDEMERAGVKEYQGSDIYVIIDEFADLMTTHKRIVTPLVQSLSQLARAAHIHLILCTQCPLRDIIPTYIKCNFDSRIALRTSTKQDSRNIIDIAGAETLPNPKTEHRAECLYKSGCEMLRYSLPTYSAEDRQRILEYWRNTEALA